MAFQDNNPTRTYVSVKNLVITYNGLNYAVNDMYSQYKYFYWSVDNPTQIEVYNTRFDKTVKGKYLLLINDKGIHTAYPNDDITITFAELGFGGGSGGVSSDVSSLQNQIDQFTKEYRTTVNTINTQIDTIGTIVKDENGNITQESVNKFIRKVDSMESSIRDVEYEYNLTKEQEELKQNLIGSFLDLLNTTGELKTELDDLPIGEAFTDVNKSAILSYFTTLDSQMTVATAYIDELIDITDAEGNTTMGSTLAVAKSSLNTIYNNFKYMVETSLSDYIYSTTDVTNVIDRMYKFISEVEICTNTCNQAINLGSGVSMINQGTNILQTKESIRLQADKITKTADSLREEIANIKIDKDEIDLMVKDSITDTIDGALKDIQIGGVNLADGTFEMDVPVEGGATNDSTYITIGTVEANNKYTLSVEKSESLLGSVKEYTVKLLNADGGTDFNTMFDISTKKQSVTFIPTVDCSVVIYAGVSGGTNGNQIRLHKVKLERGSTPTDWTPSYNDDSTLASSMSDSLTSVTEKMSDIDIQLDSINQTVSKTEKIFSEDGEYEQLKTKVSNVEQTIDGFDWTIKSTVTENGKKIDEILTEMEFTEEGLILGKSNENIKLILTNDRLYFYDVKSGKELAYFSDEKLVISDTKILNDLQIGSYAFMKDGNALMIGQI
jgi:hypothetical protein